MRKKLALAVVGILAAVSAFAFSTTPKVAHANTCGSNSPILAELVHYFPFGGVANGAYLKLEMQGVFSKSNPNADCIWTSVTVESGFNGSGHIYTRAGGEKSESFYDLHNGVWRFDFSDYTLLPHWTDLGQTLFIGNNQLNGPSPYGNECLLVNNAGTVFWDWLGDAYQGNSGGMAVATDACPT